MAEAVAVGEQCSQQTSKSETAKKKEQERKRNSWGTARAWISDFENNNRASKRTQTLRPQQPQETQRFHSKGCRNLNIWRGESTSILFEMPTLKKSKKDICLASSPTSLILSRKKNMLVSLASMMLGCFIDNFTTSKRSCRLSLPRKNARFDFSSHLGPVLACTDIRSKDTLHNAKRKILSITVEFTHLEKVLHWCSFHNSVVVFLLLEEKDVR